MWFVLRSPLSLSREVPAPDNSGGRVQGGSSLCGSRQPLSRSLLKAPDVPQRRQQGLEGSGCPCPPPNTPSCPEQTELAPVTEPCGGRGEVNNPFAKLPRRIKAERISRAPRSIWENHSGFPGSDPMATLRAPEHRRKHWRPSV